MKCIGTSEEEYNTVRQKKRATLVIYRTLSGLNEYTKACRSNKFVGAKMKKTTEDIITWHIMQQKLGHFKG